jgi:hypothetical protein
VSLLVPPPDEEVSKELLTFPIMLRAAAAKDATRAFQNNGFFQEANEADFFSKRKACHVSQVVQM